MFRNWVRPQVGARGFLPAVLGRHRIQAFPENAGTILAENAGTILAGTDLREG